MAKIYAWHSSDLMDPDVYHDDDHCADGNNVESYSRTLGTDERPHCPQCVEPNAAKPYAVVYIRGIPIPLP